MEVLLSQTPNKPFETEAKTGQTRPESLSTIAAGYCDNRDQKCSESPDLLNQNVLRHKQAHDGKSDARSSVRKSR